MKTEEGYIEVPGGKVWYRAVGDEADAIPLLCLPAGPGEPDPVRQPGQHDPLAQ